MSAKRIFDVAAIATTIGGVFLLLDGGSSSRHQPLMVIDLSSGNFNSSTHDDFFERFSINEGQPIHHATDVVSFYEEDPVQNDTYYEEHRAVEQETTRQQPIDVGDVAELYGPHSHLATPVIVSSWESDGKGGIVYNLIHAETRQKMPSMGDSSYVHRYEPYPDGTDAVCTLDQGHQGLRKKPTLSPCRVVQHKMNPKVTSGLTEGRSFATYQVTYVNVSGENVEIYLPFASVHRVLAKTSLGHLN
ncbi:hypothetical protein THAOC_05954 [Thalassiosira oceanica]|uniref:Uncharacterized protein n=1 Tax=Thalassiosira oceanica TaxID=159749 RepID=K0TFW8_THAOC|nr:hypothetical protein THAOC_05954 [Thalassiosira oceanica]|eukprot:EJK72511.1 hypothetical protein THAOC_05954 [Thalassiosira oceanica]